VVMNEPCWSRASLTDPESLFGREIRKRFSEEGQKEP
jgi:hypothetical protein